MTIGLETNMKSPHTLLAAQETESSLAAKVISLASMFRHTERQLFCPALIRITEAA